MKLDVLVIAPHPDDAELSCGGTLLQLKSMNKKTGVIDLTMGELGTRGNPETRMSESKKASKILGLCVRENLGFEDGFFTNDSFHQLEIIKKIRQYKPDILITSSLSDRHPNHEKAAEMVETSAFLSGLAKIHTNANGLDSKKQEMAWRPRLVLHFIQDRYLQPDITVDISNFFKKKMEAILCYKSQFYNPDYQKKSKQAQTYISTPDYLEFIHARALEFGHAIGVKYGEGFQCKRRLGIGEITKLI